MSLEDLYHVIEMFDVSFCSEFVSGNMLFYDLPEHCQRTSAHGLQSAHTDGKKLYKSTEKTFYNSSDNEVSADKGIDLNMNEFLKDHFYL